MLPRKNVWLFFEGKMNGLYLITAPLPTKKLLDLVQKAISGGVSVVQLRDKLASEEEILEKGKMLLPMLKQANIPLVINDHWCVAKKLGVGLHIGMDDGDPQEARKFLGNDALLGITVHTQIDRILRFQHIVNYVGVGPIFPTATKKDTKPVCGLYGLNEMVRQSPLPVVAIGGINASNIASVAMAGPDAIAVCSAICSSTDPLKETRFLVRSINENRTA